MAARDADKMPGPLQMTHWSDRYMRVPFVDGGRDMAGADCWGLVRMVLKDMAGVEVPAYGDISATELAAVARQMTADAAGPLWVPVAEPKELDVVGMRWFAKEGIGHVGIMIDGRRMLHSEDGTGPVVVDIGHYSIKRRIVKFVRHRELVHEHA